MPNGPTNFRSTVVKPYLRDPDAQDIPKRVASPTNDDEEGETSHNEEPPRVEPPPSPMQA
ncbi:hypothetical protein E4U17_007574 [Claviceps sp. LM77 group G4]|nr:hypothetical protein E4U17_007574 [Claviceps sp. LM77 group G4]